MKRFTEIRAYQWRMRLSADSNVLVDFDSSIWNRRAFLAKGLASRRWERTGNVKLSSYTEAQSYITDKMESELQRQSKAGVQNFWILCAHTWVYYKAVKTISWYFYYSTTMIYVLWWWYVKVTILNT